MPVWSSGRHVGAITGRWVRGEVTSRAVKTYGASSGGAAANVLALGGSLAALHRRASREVTVLAARVLEHGADCLERRNAFRAGTSGAGRDRHGNPAHRQNQARE